MLADKEVIMAALNIKTMTFNSSLLEEEPDDILEQANRPNGGQSTQYSLCSVLFFPSFLFLLFSFRNMYLSSASCLGLAKGDGHLRFC